eukprot:scaffold294040_cov34-Prasinocladus_malaysianus.AAC.1
MLRQVQTAAVTVEQSMSDSSEGEPMAAELSHGILAADVSAGSAGNSVNEGQRATSAAKMASHVVRGFE